MSKFSINGHNLFAKLFNTNKANNTQKVDYTTVPMAEKPTESLETPWTNLLGVNISTQPKGQPYFSDADLAEFVAQYATDISPETVEDVTSSMEGIMSADFDVVENVVPEDVQDAYIGHIVDGTADRIQAENSSRLFATDIDDAVDGDAELFDIAGLLFNDAARTNAA